MTPTPQKRRLDELPLDRRIAGEARGLGASAVFERRELDPLATHLKRRTGTLRTTNTQPNLLGATYSSSKGRIVPDYDFTAATGEDWTIIGTVDVAATTSEEDRFFKVLSFGGIYLYVKKTYDGAHKAQFIAVDAVGTQLTQTGRGSVSTASALHFFLSRDDGDLRLNAWYVSDSPTVGADNVALAPTFAAGPTLELFGENQTSYTPQHPGCVVSNVTVHDSALAYDSTAYNNTARDTTPDTSGLLWHDTFADGGDILVFDAPDPDIYAYLIPTQPQLLTSTSTDIDFGGLGTVEIPFYLDFDEYFWTTTNAQARLQWCFQLKLTLPKILSDNPVVIFELQDLVRLELIKLPTQHQLQAVFNDGGTTVLNTVALAAGTSYEVYVARDTSLSYIKVDTTEVSGTSSNPIIYAYDKTLGFVLGDRVDFQISAPFGGRIERFALHNNESRTLQDREDAVFYFDADSVQGDEFIDRGNRALNGYLGVRSDTQAPFYEQGGFPGGSYVAATGGYLVSNSRPDIDYTGQLRKPLTKDVVIQRRGQRAFLTSNGVSYIVDDKTKSFRPLGIPRPSTKVSCSPQGVGPIDGFVRYAYRYVSTDGTVGPVFELDPCDATGGVNVLLGADNFGTPTDPAFGLSFGESEGPKLVSADEVECFIARDYDASNNQLLHREITDPGLTLETAIRLPDIADAVKESVISQGVHAPFGAGRWMARNAPKEFPWIGAQNQECCFQFSFRWNSAIASQTLFGIGAEDQKYKTGWLTTQTHWRLNHLCVSLQTPADVANAGSLVITRDDPMGSNHRDNELQHAAFDVNLIADNDFTVFVSRGGTLWGNAPGADLSVALYNHTTDNWFNFADHALDVQRIVADFWGSSYSGAARDKVMWGACRKENHHIDVKTRVRSAAGSDVFDFDHLNGFGNATATDGTGGQRMYHGRMWRRDHPLTLLANKALDRYGARAGPLKNGLEIDVAFCPDSSVDKLPGGWDYPNENRVRFFAPNGIEAYVDLTATVDQTVFLAYGYDNTITPGTPDTHATTSTDDIPLWCTYTSRDEGSLVIGVGRYPAVSIAKKKWHDGSGVQTFDEFAGTIDLSQWTWLTLYFNQIERLGADGTYDVWLERVFIDGNTGEWGDLYNGDTAPGGPPGMSNNTAAGNGQYSLFSVGGVPGIDSDFEVETAETRLWDGEVYTSPGGGNGADAFGPYLSTRIPPNKWASLWHYLRFAPLDVDNMDSQATMDQRGTFVGPTGVSQQTADAVKIYQGAEVKEGGDVNESGGSSYFIPFPTPPLPSIRGIQIFRTQVVPVAEEYPNGEPNPNAQTDAFKACRAAPLYYVSEIPDGTSFYFDSAIDTLLGAELNLTEGLIPGNPGGVFEWDNYLAIWVTDIPRIHFAASPDSWESFPSDRVLDLPLREYGTIEAATEIASRDARQSRVLVLGKSWGLFLDGSPTAPRVNTLGGGIGAASSRCLVVEKGIAYAYNGTLWAITGDGAVEDIGLPVLDLLPPPDKASALGSLYVINEETGLTLRWHFARREWFVEDRAALSTTDIAGADYWVHLTGYPSKGDTATYADDVESDTLASYTVDGWNANLLQVADTTGLQIGQRITVAADQDPRIRHTRTIAALTATVITLDTALDPVLPTATDNTASGETITGLTYSIYPGVGYWGTMLDTGQFSNTGVLHHVDVGLASGSGWWAMSQASDFAGVPTDRSGFDAPESQPTHVVDSGGVGTSARWGLTARQRIQRLLVWSYEPSAIGLSEFELNYSDNE